MPFWKATICGLSLLALAVAGLGFDSSTGPSRRLANEADDEIAAYDSVLRSRRNIPPRQRFKPGFDSKGNLRTSIGIIVDSGCFKKEPAKKDELAGTIEIAISQLEQGLDRCGERRGLPALEATLNKRIATFPSVTCASGLCDKNNGACAWSEKNLINFANTTELGDASTWFHELLHLIDADNQDIETHNKHTPEVDLRDQIVFGERHCFDQGKILDAMRTQLDAPKACAAALKHQPNQKRAPDPWQVELVCGLYDEYLVRERVFAKTVERVLFPEVFKCLPGRDSLPCPDVGALAAPLAPLARKGIRLPSFATARRWIDAHCKPAEPGRVRDLAGCIDEFYWKFSDALFEHEKAGAPLLDPGMKARAAYALRKARVAMSEAMPNRSGTSFARLALSETATCFQGSALAFHEAHSSEGTKNPCTGTRYFSERNFTTSAGLRERSPLELRKARSGSWKVSKAPRRTSTKKSRSSPPAPSSLR